MALFFGTQSALLYANSGGAIQQLPPVYNAGGKQRSFAETVTLAGQAAGSQIMVNRLPLPFVLTGVTYVTTVSLGTATIALGDFNSAALYAAAQTLTVTDTPTRVGKANIHGTPITTGYDAQGGQPTAYAPGQGGFGYDDMLLTTAVAALPGSGTLVVIVEYCID